MKTINGNRGLFILVASIAGIALLALFTGIYLYAQNSQKKSEERTSIEEAIDDLPDFETSNRPPRIQLSKTELVIVEAARGHSRWEKIEPIIEKYGFKKGPRKAQNVKKYPSDEEADLRWTETLNNNISKLSKTRLTESDPYTYFTFHGPFFYCMDFVDKLEEVGTLGIPDRDLDEEGAVNATFYLPNEMIHISCYIEKDLMIFQRALIIAGKG